MEIPHWVESVSTIFGSGGAGWFAAWLKHRRLKSAPVKEERKLEKRLEEVDNRILEHIRAYNANNAGWMLELQQLKNDLEEDRKIREAIEVERNSHPDPLEDIRHELNELRRLLDRQREKSGRYVKNEAFEAFVRAQEEQWREINRQFGRLEGTLQK